MATTAKTKAKKKIAKPARKTRVSQSALAAQATAEIRALGTKLGIGKGLKKAERSKLTSSASTSNDFIEEVAATVDQHGSLVGASFDVDQAREAIAYSAAYETVVIEIERLARRLSDEILRRRAAAGSGALAVYAAMKGAARTAEGEELNDALATLKALMKKKHAPAVAPADSTDPAKKKGA